RRRNDARVEADRQSGWRLISQLQLVHLARPVSARQPPEPGTHDDVDRAGQADGGRPVEQDERIGRCGRGSGDRADELDADVLGEPALRGCRRGEREEYRGCDSPGSATREMRRHRHDYARSPPATIANRGAVMEAVVRPSPMTLRSIAGSAAASACTTSAS